MEGWSNGGVGGGAWREGGGGGRAWKKAPFTLTQTEEHQLFINDNSIWSRAVVLDGIMYVY